MNPLTLNLVGRIAAHIPHRRPEPRSVPAGMCTGVYFRSSVIRHGSVATCPFCSEAPVLVEPLKHDKARVRVLPHERRDAVGEVITVVDR